MHYKTAILALLLTSSSFATQIILQDAENISLLQQNGDTWDDTLAIQLGAFQTGFTPTKTNLESWSANFLSVGKAGYYDPEIPEWSTALTLKDNSEPFAFGTQLYLWAHSDMTIGTGSQWLLLSDASWTVGTMVATGLPQDLHFSVNTSAIAGEFDFADQTAFTMETSPIPEPSTYAAIFGALTLGGVCYRRYRRK